MNTKLNIKTRRSLFSAIVANLLVGVVVMLVLGGLSAQAQTSTFATTPRVDSSITIATSGTVNDPNGNITLNGNVIITCRKVVDTTTTTPVQLVLLDFDFSQLSGTRGAGKNVTTFVTGGNHATEMRPFQASDTIVVTLPFFDSTQDVTAARTALVNATLNFDISTGKLTSGTLSVGNNTFTSTGVGAFTPAL